MYCVSSPLCRVRHSAKPVLQALDKAVDSGSVWIMVLDITGLEDDAL
jgi:broad specificity phosphatase PhoE